MNGSAFAFAPVLDQLESPAVLIQDGKITHANPGAKALFLGPGDPAAPLLGEDWEAIGADADRVRLPVCIGPQHFQGSLTRWDDADMLILEPEMPDGIDYVALLRLTTALRLPLQDLITSADILFPALEEQESEFIQGHTATITRAYYRLIRTVVTAGDVCVLAQGDAVMKPEKTEMCNFVASVAGTAESFCTRCGVPLKLELPNTLFTGLVDRQLLERAIFQLLSNGIRFAPKGTGMTLRLEHRGDRALLRLRHAGTDTPPTKNPPGAGFGLELARRVAALHGGSLMLESTPDGGSTLLLTLALYRDGTEKLAASPAEEFDYAGGLQHGHLEFSDFMPDAAYDTRSL